MDILPGGTSVTWCRGVRPAWFLGLSQPPQEAIAAQPVPTQPDREQVPVAEVPASADADSQQLRLSRKQSKACAKATKKLLQASSGSCKVKTILSHVQLTLMSDFDVDAGAAKALKKRWKQHLHESEAWQIQGGFVTVATEA